jgi:cobalt-zinc-cadmium resistance protein CzcA
MPVLVKDIAVVHVGNQPRPDIAGQDDNNDIVQGIVLMRRGEQSMPAIHAVETKVEKINTADFAARCAHREDLRPRWANRCHYA